MSLAQQSTSHAILKGALLRALQGAAWAYWRMAEPTLHWLGVPKYDLVQVSALFSQL